MTMIDETTTLANARRELLAQLDEGARCPCCGQLAKVYRRSLNRGMANALIDFYRAGDGTRDYVHGPSVTRSHEAAQLAWWRLIEEETARRDDGGRSGWWRVTMQGSSWLRRAVTVPRFAVVYDAKLLRLEGRAWSIDDALGESFDLRRLLYS